LEHRRINAMRLVHKKRTGQPWDKPGHDERVGAARTTDGRHKAPT
jgi:hypothetical protein